MSDMMPLVEMTSVCSDCRLPLHDLHDGRSVCPRPAAPYGHAARLRTGSV